MISHNIVVGGASGIGRILVSLILSSSTDNVYVIDKALTGTMPIADKRLLELNVDIGSKVKWDTKFHNISRIKSICIVVPSCRPRDPSVNELGYTPNFVENVGEVSLGLLNLIDAAKPLLCNSSSIVLVSSVLGNRVAIADATLDYHASKAVVEAIARYMAVRLAPKTMVNCVSPGLIARNDSSALLTDSKTKLAVARSTPLGRPYSQEEIAEAIWALASGKLGLITGQTITIDGGSSALDAFSISR
jgi:NAD(P)-dependent dehydrogenase (short-subunit alcohol dehydrogenase family)